METTELPAWCREIEDMDARWLAEQESRLSIAQMLWAHFYVATPANGCGLNLGLGTGL